MERWDAVWPACSLVLFQNSFFQVHLPRAAIRREAQRLRDWVIEEGV